jgi:hypothetical protein
MKRPSPAPPPWATGPWERWFAWYPVALGWRQRRGVAWGRMVWRRWVCNPFDTTRPTETQFTLDPEKETPSDPTGQTELVDATLLAERRKASAAGTD